MSSDSNLHILRTKIGCSTAHFMQHECLNQFI